MTQTIRPPATRSGLLKLVRRLAHVQRASSLLHRKREVLVTELMRRARPTIDARDAIEAAMDAACEPLAAALAEHGRTTLSAIGLPPRSVRVGLAMVDVWGEHVPTVVERSPLGRSMAARATAPGITGVETTQAAAGFERVIELVLDAVSDEAALRRLGEAVARTTRQVNVLERRIGPRLQAQRRAMAGTLDERERDDHVRLKHLLGARRGRPGAAPVLAARPDSAQPGSLEQAALRKHSS